MQQTRLVWKKTIPAAKPNGLSPNIPELPAFASKLLTGSFPSNFSLPLSLSLHGSHSIPHPTWIIMEAPETPPSPHFPDIVLSGGRNISDHGDGPIQNDSLAADLELLRHSYPSSQFESVAAEQRGAVASFREREEELAGKMDEERRQREAVELEVQVLKERIGKLEEEKRTRDVVLSRCSEATRSAKESLERMISSMGEGNVEIRVGEGDEMEEVLNLDEETRPLWGELMEVTKLATVAEANVGEYQAMRKKEKRELENSMVSLTEENRDINSLLRIALVEKETVEKSLNRLKGNTDQKRVPLFQFAERGLQKVGFGFMKGAAANEQSSDNSGASICSKSDSSDCEEEGVSLVR